MPPRGDLPESCMHHHFLIASFDVFDTILTRCVGVPHEAFLLLGRTLREEGLLLVDPGHFARLRMEAESRARSNSRAEEVTLPDIYRELVATLRLSDAEADAIQAVELRIEATILRPVGPAVTLLATERERGHRVVFVSDTYLPVEFVQTLLLEHHIAHETDGLYVSSSIGRTKATGRLFQFMLSSERVPARAVIHYGNDVWSDIRMSNAVGITGILLADCNHNKYETMLQRHSAQTAGITGRFTAASRFARLGCCDSSLHRTQLTHMAAGLVAPTLTAYVMWVLRAALDMRLERLYFLARDGEILSSISRRLVARLGIHLDIRYLYISRQAVHLAALRSIGTFERSWILDDTTFLSVESFLYRVGLVPSEVRAALEEVGLAGTRPSKNLTKRERAQLRNLLQLSTVRGLVIKAAEERRRLVLAYLRQAGLGDEARSGLVDIGWLGRQHKSINEILLSGGHECPITFFFGLRRGGGGSAYGRVAYCFDETRNIGLCEALQYTDVFIESFCLGSHGVVVGYSQRGCEVVPLFRSDHNLEAEDWGLDVIHKTVNRFVDALFRPEDLMAPAIDLRYALADAITEVWEHPSLPEARAWGSLPYEDDQGGFVRYRLASPLRARDLLRALGPTRSPIMHRAAWREGTLKLTPVPLRVTLRALQTLNAVAQEVRAPNRHEAAAKQGPGLL